MNMILGSLSKHDKFLSKGYNLYIAQNLVAHCLDRNFEGLFNKNLKFHLFETPHYRHIIIQVFSLFVLMCHVQLLRLETQRAVAFHIHDTYRR